MNEDEANIQKIKEQKVAIRENAPRLKYELSVPMTTELFSEKIKEIRDTYGFQLVNTPQSGYYIEAHIAAEFARWRNASHVWLSDHDPPDFCVKHNCKEISYEITEIVNHKIRRDKDLQALYENGTPLHRPAKNWLSVDEAVKKLNDALDKKSTHRYRNVDGLIIYLNTGFLTHNGPLRDGKKKALDQFKSEDFKTHYREIWLTYEDVFERIR